MKEVSDFLESFDRCLASEPAFCTMSCPFHVDVNSMISYIRDGMFSAAYRSYRDAVCFPEVVSLICPTPCALVCPMKDGYAAIDLLGIERALIETSSDVPQNSYNLPNKNQRIAIVGGDAEAIACAARLAGINYQVDIFGQEELGSQIQSLVGDEVYTRDVVPQIESKNINFVQNVIPAEAGIYAAIYTAEAPSLDAIGTTFDIARGLLAAAKIDAALKSGGALDTIILSTKDITFDTTTKIKVDPRKIAAGLVVEPIDRKGEIAGQARNDTLAQVDALARAQATVWAQAEASRCILCRCDACRSYCDLLEYTNKWPKRIRDEVFATTIPGSAEVKATPAKRLMSTCNLCGVCAGVCPEDIDMDGLILAGRRSMHKQEKAPWAFHDFWVRDMKFANSEISKTRISAKRFAFFPGCQIGASIPGAVVDTFNLLRSLDSDMGMLLRCCGAPAEWSGDVDLHRQSLDELRADWKTLGKPTLLCACPTCMKMFSEYLPDIPYLSVYTYLAENLDCDKRGDVVIRFAVFDPCSAAEDETQKLAVRKLAEASGVTLEPLPLQNSIARCCGWGGQPGVADPDYQEFAAKRRVSESDLPYITYCVNCRDLFTAQGKRAVHILEMLTASAAEIPAFAGMTGVSLPTVSERRENRVKLKELLMKHDSDEIAGRARNDADAKFVLHISDELKFKLDSQKILEDEVYDVVENLLRTGRVVINQSSGTKSGYRKLGYMTYWVEFREIEGKHDNIELVNAYSHRMSIEHEPVWNGHKIDEVDDTGEAH